MCFTGKICVAMLILYCQLHLVILYELRMLTSPQISKPLSNPFSSVYFFVNYEQFVVFKLKLQLVNNWNLILTTYLVSLAI